MLQNKKGPNLNNSLQKQSNQSYQNDEEYGIQEYNFDEDYDEYYEEEYDNQKDYYANQNQRNTIQTNYNTKKLGATQTNINSNSTNVQSKLNLNQKPIINSGSIYHHVGAKEMRQLLEEDDKDALELLNNNYSKQQQIQPSSQSQRSIIPQSTTMHKSQSQNNLKNMQSNQSNQTTLKPSNNSKYKAQNLQSDLRNKNSQLLMEEADVSFEMYTPVSTKPNQKPETKQYQSSNQPNHQPISNKYSNNDRQSNSSSSYKPSPNIINKEYSLNNEYKVPIKRESSSKSSKSYEIKPEKTPEEVERSAMTEGSYAKTYKRKIDFQPYTIDDYKSMKMKVKGLEKLGGLGPDLESEEVKKKREKQERMKKYAKLIKKENADYLTNVPKKPIAPEPPKLSEARERMKEFASQIPKPKPKSKSKSKIEPSSSHSQQDEEYEPELSELELLELQHQQDEDWMRDQFGENYGVSK